MTDDRVAEIQVEHVEYHEINDIPFDDDCNTCYLLNELKGETKEHVPIKKLSPHYVDLSEVDLNG